MGPVEPGSLRGGVGGGGERAPRGGGGGRPQPFPPGSPGTERAGGCGRPPPAALRGIAAELRPFLFRRFLPLSPGPAVWAPRPRALPPRPRLAFPRMRRSLPSGKGRARLPGAAAPPLGSARCGVGAVPGGAPVCGRGSRSARAPAALRRERGGRPGGGHRAAATAPSPAPPPPSPHPPQKNAAAAAEPIGVCITSCLLLFLPGPRAHPPAWGEGGDGRTGAQCALFGWKRPNARMGGSAGGAQRSLSPGGLRGKNRCPPAAAAEGRGWGGLAAEHRRPPG